MSPKFLVYLERLKLRFSEGFESPSLNPFPPILSYQTTLASKILQLIPSPLSPLPPSTFSFDEKTRF